MLLFLLVLAAGFDVVFSSLFSSHGRHPGLFFDTLPFVPRSEWRPEKYVKSPRNKRSILDELVRQNETFIGLDLNKVHKPMPDTSKPFDGPVVIPILFGNYSAIADMRLISASVTLVMDDNTETDERCYVVVDTGLPLFKNSILGGLAAHGVHPMNITSVVVTHFDVETVGNLNLFPHANIFSRNKVVNRQFTYTQKGGVSFEPKVGGLPFRQLCDHTSVYLTPGASSRQLSVIIRNVQGYGTLAIVGNLIFDVNDLLTNHGIGDTTFGTPSAEDKQIWQLTRREIVCLSDYIIPGYGSTFKVSPAIKAHYKCSNYFPPALNPKRVVV